MNRLWFTIKCIATEERSCLSSMLRCRILHYIQFLKSRPNFPHKLYYVKIMVLKVFYNALPGRIFVFVYSHWCGHFKLRYQDMEVWNTYIAWEGWMDYVVLLSSCVNRISYLTWYIYSVLRVNGLYVSNESISLSVFMVFDIYLYLFKAQVIKSPSASQCCWLCWKG